MPTTPYWPFSQHCTGFLLRGRCYPSHAFTIARIRRCTGSPPHAFTGPSFNAAPSHHPAPMFDLSSLSFSRDRQTEGTLVDQIVTAISRAIDTHAYPAGEPLPSIRGLAKHHRLSAYTVAEAYHRLVSMGQVVSRAGAGYRVADRHKNASSPTPIVRSRPSLNAGWLLSDVFVDQSVPIKAGCGWLPNDWINESGMQRALRTLSRLPGARIGGYGHPYGLSALREHIAASLRRYGMAIDESQVLLTQGATQALDLIVRTLLRPGDTVVVEDPCYCNLLQILKVANVHVVGVPRTVDGIDAAAFEHVVKTHRPVALFVNPVLQNPSGASFSAASAFRLLQVADQYGIWVIEDDISRELAPAGQPCLAAMEGLERVIYLSGFSKTITPAVRVGYIAANASLLSQLALTKMAVGLTSSELTERAVLNVLIEGHYDRHVAAVKDRLSGAHERVATAMRQVGMAVFQTPNAGLFLWAKLPDGAHDSHALSTRALDNGIWLAPGSYFRPGDTASSWFRFNAATSDVPALWDFFRSLV